MIALSVAAVLAIFLVYTSLAGGGTPSVQPSELSGRDGRVGLSGRVVGAISGDAHGAGMRFRLRDVEGTKSVPVVYKGSVPGPFKKGRDVHLEGELRNGVFVAVPGSLVTKCPSKYAPEAA